MCSVEAGWPKVERSRVQGSSRGIFFLCAFYLLILVLSIAGFVSAPKKFGRFFYVHDRSKTLIKIKMEKAFDHLYIFIQAFDSEAVRIRS